MSASPVILITGASSGIGAATSRLFARQGYRVVLAARRVPRLTALAEEIRAEGGCALPVPVDVCAPADLHRLVAATLECFGQIDVLFNNAGMGRVDWLENLDPVEDVERQVQVNLLGQIELAQAVLPHMLARRSGQIINMGSVASLIASPTYSIYAASKFGVRGFTEALRREVGVYGVRVSGIYPGGTETEFTEQAGIRRKTGTTTPAFLRLSPDDVARAVLGLVRRPRRMLVIPWPWRLAAWVNDLFPEIVDWAIEQHFVRPERGL